MEASGDDRVHNVLRRVVVAARQVDGGHYNPVLESFVVAAAVLRAHGVGTVELHGTHVGLETVAVPVRLFEQFLELVEGERFDGFALPQVIVDQVVGLLAEVVEEHGVLVYVFEVVGAGSFLVLVELELPVFQDVDFTVEILVGGVGQVFLL